MAINRGEKSLRFEASSRLQRLFGRDLIPDDDSAVEELVKNAYDSNASEVVVTVVRGTEGRDGEIEIRDNGMGLGLKEFERVWMRAGYSEKTGQPLPKTGRIQVGEKGIGRFAADKLGSHLIVLTKPRDVRETLEVTFDWPKFEHKNRKLSDIPIPYRLIQDDLLPKETSGTILRISKLRAEWPDRSIEQLRKRLSRLLNPYDKDRSFSIVLKAPTAKLSGAIVPSEIENADFEWEINRTAAGRVRIKRRQRLQRDSDVWSEWEPVSNTKYELQEDLDFGPVKAKIFFFVDRPKKANIGNAEPGVAIYRDGMRVEPAGSSNADWLGLLEKRAKRAGHMPLVPSRLFGFVQISRLENPGIEDATNRRAFIHGPKLDAFREYLQARLGELESQVEAEVAKPRWEKSRQAKSQSLVQARYKTVSILSLSLAHELRQPLQAIQSASENIDGYLEARGVAIEEVSAASQVIRRNIDRINKHIQFLKAVGSGPQESEEFDSEDAADEVVRVFQEYGSARNVKLSLKKGSPSIVLGNRATYLATLTNLIINACQAVEGAQDKVHHVTVSIHPVRRATTVRVTDDGPGIVESNRSRLFKRQTTTKQGGMGIGLIVWREALQMFGGDLECESFGDPTIFAMTIPNRT